MGKIKDITGQRFGNLVALSPTTIRKNGNVVWMFQCDCGKITEKRQGAVVHGETTSCGHKLRLSYGESSFNHLYDKYKRGALSRNLEFSLSKEEFKLLTQQKCHYCQQPPSTIVTTKNYFGEYQFNGIDRKDNTIGYTIENSLPCCKECNFAKRTTPYLDFISWLKRFKDVSF